MERSGRRAEPAFSVGEEPSRLHWLLWPLSTWALLGRRYTPPVSAPFRLPVGTVCTHLLLF